MQKIDQNNLPTHVAITMDGNGRWAKKKGKIRNFGHKNGVNAVRESVEIAAEIGIKHLTLYAFSTENWQRAAHEVKSLMKLFRGYLQSKFVELVNTNSIALDISGYTIYDNVGLRHTFADGSILSGGGVAIVFGGGSPTGEFGGADIVTTATGGSLSLNNAGDKVIINDKNGNQIIEFEWGGSTPYDGGSDQSLTRDPDLTGDFVLHSTTVAGGVYSPGTQTDGSAFDVGLNDPTTIQFALREFTLANNDGSYDLQDYSIEVAISNPSATIATQAQVVFTASDNGSAADINNYVGEVITFGSGTSDSQNSVVKITNANIALGTRYDFALLNVSGGNAATTSRR